MRAPTSGLAFLQICIEHQSRNPVKHVASKNQKEFMRDIKQVYQAVNKEVFTSDTALEKIVYLAFTKMRKKWTQPVQNWGQSAQHLAILFPDRFKILV